MLRVEEMATGVVLVELDVEAVLTGSSLHGFSWREFSPALHWDGKGALHERLCWCWCGQRKRRHNGGEEKDCTMHGELNSLLNFPLTNTPKRASG